DLQRNPAHDLAEQSPAHDKNRSDGAPNVKLRIPPAGFFMRASPSFHRRATDNLAEDVAHRCPDLPDRLRLRRGLLHLRPARIESAHLDERNPPVAGPPRTRRWSFLE